MPDRAASSVIAELGERIDRALGYAADPIESVHEVGIDAPTRSHRWFLDGVFG